CGGARPLGGWLAARCAYFFGFVYYCVGQLAGSRPGGRGTLLARPRKVRKRRPPPLLATLRVAKGNLCRGVCGVCRETHYAPEALRSDRRGKLVDEALALCGASATPQTPRPRRMQKGGCKQPPNSQIPIGHRCARPAGWPSAAMAHVCSTP